MMEKDVAFKLLIDIIRIICMIDFQTKIKCLKYERSHRFYMKNYFE